MERREGADRVGYTHGSSTEKDQMPLNRNSEREIKKFIITDLATEGANHRSEATRVIAYLGKNSPESRRLEETIRRASKARTVTLCRTLKVLREVLRFSLTMNTVVVLLAASRRVLLNLLSFQDRFDHLPIIVIVPDAGEKTLARAHRLRPRYVTLIGSDFSDVEFVLARLLERVDRQRNPALRLNAAMKK